MIYFGFVATVGTAYVAAPAHPERARGGWGMATGVDGLRPARGEQPARRPRGPRGGQAHAGRAARARTRRRGSTRLCRGGGALGGAGRGGPGRRSRSWSATCRRCASPSRTRRGRDLMPLLVASARVQLAVGGAARRGLLRDPLGEECSTRRRRCASGRSRWAAWPASPIIEGDRPRVTRRGDRARLADEARVEGAGEGEGRHRQRDERGAEPVLGPGAGGAQRRRRGRAASPLRAARSDRVRRQCREERLGQPLVEEGARRRPRRCVPPAPRRERAARRARRRPRSRASRRAPRGGAAARGGAGRRAARRARRRSSRRGRTARRAAPRRTRSAVSLSDRRDGARVAVAGQVQSPDLVAILPEWTGTGGRSRGSG